MKWIAGVAFALLFLYGAHAWTFVYTDPPVNASTATNGSVWIVQSPPCTTAVLGRGCNPRCLNGPLGTPNCPDTQWWTYTAGPAPGDANATQCAFTFHKPPGEATGTFGVSASTTCA